MTPPGEPPQAANLSSSALNSWRQARAWTQAYRPEPSALVMSLFFEDQEQGSRRKRRMLATLRAILKERRGKGTSQIKIKVAWRRRLRRIQRPAATESVPA